MDVEDSTEPGGAGQELSVTVQWHGSTAVVAVSDEVDLVTVPQLEKPLLDVADQQPQPLVIDLSAVDFLGSVGLSVLTAAYQQVGERPGAMRVVATNPATTRPLSLTALDHHIPIYASREQALTDG